MEIQGKVAGAGQLWILVQSDRIESAKPIKIVWKMTGRGVLTLRAARDDGDPVKPVGDPSCISQALGPAVAGCRAAPEGQLRLGWWWPM